MPGLRVAPVQPNDRELGIREFPDGVREIADALRLYPDREVEIDFLDHMGRDMTNRIHRIEVRE